MKKTATEVQEVCSVDYAFQRVGGKYKGRILWQLNSGMKRYGELKRHLKDVTPKMLTQALRELEEDGLIARKVYPEVPPKVEYSLTESGLELVPCIRMLSNWGEKQMELRNIPSIVKREEQLAKQL